MAKNKRRRKNSKNKEASIDNYFMGFTEEENLRRKVFTSLDLKKVFPKNEKQSELFNTYSQGKNLFVYGSAGTGKTFLVFYKALQEVLSEESELNKIVIFRSNVATRQIGHLPGTEEEKMSVFEPVYKSICDDLFRWDNSYDNLKNNGVIEFKGTSFIRGGTLNNSFVIVDEGENLNYHELSSIMTRLGENSRIAIIGDFKQSDLPKSGRDSTGMESMMGVVSLMESFALIEFMPKDIVRSGFVKEFILAEERYEKEKTK